jgi:hypothetical protein
MGSEGSNPSVSAKKPWSEVADCDRKDSGRRSNHVNISDALLNRRGVSSVTSR